MPEFDSSIEYRLVMGFPAYRVGSDGNLWSCYTPSRGSRKGHRPLGEIWRRIEMAPKPEGYISVCLYQKGFRRYVRLHVLVLEVFRGPCPSGMEGCHENGVRSDCRLENLRWDTRSNNHKDKRKHGTSAAGEKNPQAKLTAAAVLRIHRRRAEGATYATIGIEFGISPNYAGDILNGKTWSHIIPPTGVAEPERVGRKSSQLAASPGRTN
jgi:hypothetical protein